MSCDNCFKKAVLKESGNTNFVFCGKSCQQDFYKNIDAGFFDDNPNWIQNRDTFWVFYTSGAKVPKSILLAGALKAAEPATRTRVLTWLMDPTAPIRQVFNKTRDEFVFDLFKNAAVLQSVELMQEILAKEPALQLNDARVLDLLKKMIESGRAMSVRFLIGPMRDYNEELKHACEQRHVEIVRILLAEGRANSAYNYSICLQQAVSSDNVDTVGLLLQDNKVKVSDRDYMVLEEAAYLRNRDIMGRLLDYDIHIPRKVLDRSLKNADEEFKNWAIQRWESNQIE